MNIINGRQVRMAQAGDVYLCMLKGIEGRAELMEGKKYYKFIPNDNSQSYTIPVALFKNSVTLLEDY